MKKVIVLTTFLIALIILLPTTNRAAQTEDNTGFARLAMPELLIGSGTRATALGGMAVAYINDLSSLHWNPAGLSGLDSLDFEFVHNTWIVDINKYLVLHYL